MTTQKILFQKRNQFCLQFYYIRDCVVDRYPTPVYTGKLWMRGFEVELPSVDFAV